MYTHVKKVSNYIFSDGLLLIMLIIDILYIAPFPPKMFKSGLKNSQWTDVYGPYIVK